MISIQMSNETRTLKNYILQAKIGRGAFGKVYKVINKTNRRIYAAKIYIKKIENESIDAIQDISREVAIISNFNHPSVLKFILYSQYDFKQKKQPVIITEYASNGSLRELIEREKQSDNKIMTGTQKLILIYGIASALSYLHNHDIIHRDLKPENILIDEFYFPKVADFGFSKGGPNDSQNPKTISGTIKGTPLYMSPEIWRKSEYTKSSDIYAFGIVMYEIMTLERPFNTIGIFDLMQTIAKGNRPEFTKPVSEVYKNLIQRCWSQIPSERPTSDEILKEIETNHNYITDDVDESEFLKYVQHISKYDVTFGSIDVINPLNDFINEKKLENDLMKSIQISTTSFVGKKFPYKYYENLGNENKMLVDSAEDGEVEKQFELGKCLIEGKSNFHLDLILSLKYLRESMKNGCKESVIYYIKMLIYGKIIPSNHKKALKLIEKIFKDDETTKELLYGKLYKNEKKYDSSNIFFQQCMKTGNDESFYEYAQNLRKGYGVDKNEEESIKYYLESIKLGNLKAMYKYGKILIKNEGKEKGIQLIKKSADRGYSKAQYQYYKIISNDGIDESAIEYLKRSSYNGYTESMYEYGCLLLKNDKNKELALFYLKAASDKGHFDSMFEYGRTIIEKEEIHSKRKEGVKYIKVAADNGNSEAMAYYGLICYEGILVEKSKEEAEKYFKKGIEHGNIRAINNYGYMLRYGKEDVNKEEVVKYFKMAADKGDAYGLNNYANSLYNGYGIEINYQEAMKYYIMAIDKGDLNAITSYANMQRDGIGVEPNPNEAIKYYKIGIDKGSISSMLGYAVMLSYGINIEANPTEAVKYYKMAIDKGSASAMSNYGMMLANGISIEANPTEAVKYY